MSKSIVSFDEQAVKDELRELVGKTIKETINAMLDEEADQLVGARPYERTDERTAYSAKKALISRSLSPDAIRYSSSFSRAILCLREHAIRATSPLETPQTSCITETIRSPETSASNNARTVFSTPASEVSRKEASFSSAIRWATTPRTDSQDDMSRT